MQSSSVGVYLTDLFLDRSASESLSVSSVTLVVALVGLATPTTEASSLHTFIPWLWMRAFIFSITSLSISAAFKNNLRLKPSFLSSNIAFLKVGLSQSLTSMTFRGFSDA